MNVAQSINNISIKLYVQLRENIGLIFIAAALYFLMTGDSLAAGVNRIAGLKDDAVATFGKGSDTEYYLCLAEALTCGYLYVKNKNVGSLISLPVLVAFTHWALP